MHYHVEVYLKELGDVEAQIKAALIQYDESLEIERVEDEGEFYWRNPKGFWDWWQIGGRWTGEHDGYNPADDPENTERCNLCNGTGDRKDFGPPEWKEKCGGCNGCEGKGKRVKWPTQWKKYPGDIIPVAKAKDTLTCATLIVNGDVFHQEVWNGSDFIKTDFDGNVKARLAQLGIDTGYLVTVDYHT